MSKLIGKIVNNILLLGFTYFIYWALSPISFYDHGVFYYVGCLFLALMIFCSISESIKTIREILHFFHWLILFVFDRHPGDYALIDITKRREKDRKDLESTVEYQEDKRCLNELEKFYCDEKQSTELYFYLGEYYGMKSGYSDGFKETYSESYKEGKKKLGAKIKARKEREKQESYRYYGDDSSKQKELNEDELAKKHYEEAWNSPNPNPMRDYVTGQNKDLWDW